MSLLVSKKKDALVRIQVNAIVAASKKNGSKMLNMVLSTS